MDVHQCDRIDAVVVPIVCYQAFSIVLVIVTCKSHLTALIPNMLCMLLILEGLNNWSEYSCCFVSAYDN